MPAKLGSGMKNGKPNGIILPPDAFHRMFMPVNCQAEL